MTTILITSSGFLLKPIREEILKVLPDKRPLRVAYIPTASKVVKNDDYAKRDVGIMNELGFTVSELDLSEIQGDELESNIRENDFMYVQGGNPYWLLKQTRESGFDKIAPKLIEEGMPYIGKSAGGYILAPEVSVPGWFPNNWRKFGITNVTGMGVVPFIWKAHFDSEDKEELACIKRGIQTSKYPVRVITNQQGFLIRDNETELVGLGEEFDLYK